MPRIAIPKREDAPAQSKPILDNVDKTLGFVPNLHRLMSISPNALSGWATLMGSLGEDAGRRDRETGSRWRCRRRTGATTAWPRTASSRAILAKMPADEIELNREGRSSDPKRQAAVAFAKALIETRGKVSDAQFAAVRDAGWTDANIVEMIALTAQFLLTNFMNNAGTDPDRFSRGQSREGSLMRGASFGEGRAGESNVSTVPAAWCQARLRAARSLGRHEGARRPNLAARAHERACQRRRVAEGHRPERRPQDPVRP